MVADTDWVDVAVGVIALDPVAKEKVGATEAVASSTEAVVTGVALPVAKGEAVAMEAEGGTDADERAEGDVDCVVVVDWEAVDEAIWETVPPSQGLAVGAIEKVALMVTAPEEDPERVPTSEKVTTFDTEGLWDGLGEAVGERVRREEREVEMDMDVSPVGVPLTLPTPL